MLLMLSMYPMPPLTLGVRQLAASGPYSMQMRRGDVEPTKEVYLTPKRVQPGGMSCTVPIKEITTEHVNTDYALAVVMGTAIAVGRTMQGCSNGTWCSAKQRNC